MYKSLFDTLRFVVGHPLNRHRKLRSLVRFASWQIGSRLASGPIIHEWVNGSRFLVSTGETALTGNIYTGLFEFPEMAFLLHFLRADDVFVDVGANAGSFTILACAAVGARGVAFEPVPSTYRRLVENMELNGLGKRVKCINKGVGADRGSVAFTADSGATNHPVARGEQCTNAVTVEMTSLDIALEGESPTLLKIDVEGYETSVLEGARETLRRPALSSVIMELNGSGSRYGFDESRILREMEDCGFGPYSYDPLKRELVGLDGKNQESGNTLFIRDKSFVAKRLRSSARVFVHGRHV